MKTIQKTLLVLLVSTLFLIACNDKKTKKSPIVTPTQETSKKTTQTKDRIIFKEISRTESSRYEDNLRIKSGKNDSYVTLKDNTVHLKFPVSNTNFKHFATYNISTTDKKAILYVITDGTQRASKDMKYMAYAEVKFNTVIKPLELTKDEKLYIIVLHDDFEKQTPKEIIRTLFDATIIVTNSNKSNNNITFCDEIQKSFEEPKTACGGVIVDYY